MTNVEYSICDVHGDLFEYVANHYTYDTFVAFIPAFLHSDFCKRQWDAPYSRYQLHTPEENLDFIQPELTNIPWTEAKETDEVFNNAAAHWIGFMYRALYITTGVASAILADKIPLSKMCTAYPGLHTIAEEDAVEELQKLL